MGYATASGQQLRRLFSTFAHGSPGAGLLLMRLVAGIALVVHGVTTLRGQTTMGAAILHGLSAGAGILLLAGLWTLIAGALVAVISLWHAFSQPRDRWSCIMLGTLGAALALLGPGAWSVLAFLAGSASTLQIEKVRSHTSFELVPTYFNWAFPSTRLGVLGDSIWGCRQTGVPPEYAQ
jgi:putative oxidoreductase